MKPHNRASFWMIGLAIAIPISLAFGHIWATDETVHFKATGLDFGRPPLRYDLNGTGASDAGSSSDWRPGTQYVSPPYRELTKNDPYSDFDPNYLYRKTNSLEGAGEFQAALDKWNWAKAKEIGSGCGSDSRIELLKTILGAKNRRGAIALLAATRELNSSKQFPLPMDMSPELRPTMLMERCLVSKQPDRQKGKEYTNIAHAYPHSKVAIDALEKAIQSYLAQGSVEITASDIQASQQLLHELERSQSTRHIRFVVLGWKGRIQYVQKHYARAIEIYRRQQELARNHSQAQEVVNSIVRCCKRLGNRSASAAALLEGYDNETTGFGRGTYYRLTQLQIDSFSAKDSSQFWRRLRTSPRLLSAYLDFRQEMDHPSRDLLHLAERNLGPALKSKYGSHILLRIAEVAYNLDELPTAKVKALAAQMSATQPDDKALATYILASVAKKQGDWVGAQKGYQSILTSYPSDYLVGASRENLALVFERKHEFGNALEQYWKLNYVYDVAYLIDVRMTPKEIEDYMAQHPNSEHTKLLKFSLGIRYLRKDQFKSAALVLSKLSAKSRENLSRLMDHYAVQSKEDPMDRIQDPLITAQQLGTLYNHYNAAQTNNAKAVAKWKIACYYYDHRDLLLYNPALWLRVRTVAIGFQWNSEIATKEDYRALNQHHWEHECYAKTLILCKQILKEFPQSPIRFQAAYRGACAAERLARMNPYWRWEGERKDILGQSVNLMAYARRSPDPGLAKAAKKFASIYANDREDQLVAFRDLKKERAKYKRTREFADWTWY